MEQIQDQTNVSKKVFILFSVAFLLVIAGYLAVKFNVQTENKEINKTDKKEIDITPQKAEEEVKVSPILNKSWSWQNTKLMDDTLITPKDSTKFVLTFNENNAFGTTTDCNRGFGKYSLDGSKLNFLGIGSTKMACPESQEGIYFKDLQEVESFMIEDDKLILQLKLDTGYMTFVELKD